jgi:chromosome partitioning protein
MPIILAVANEKGGCGKTTTTINIAGGLQKVGYTVEVVDADLQASATHWSLNKGQRLPFNVSTARNVGSFSKLRSLPVDFVLVDCPPGAASSDEGKSNAFVREAVRRSDAILVPLRASMLDFRAASSFVDLLAQDKPPAVKTAVLINDLQLGTLLSKQAHKTARDLFSIIPGALVLQSAISHRTVIAEVSGAGQTIFDYASPRHPAVQEYINLTKELIEWLIPAQDSTLQISTAQSHPSEQELKTPSLA